VAQALARKRGDYEVLLAIGGAFPEIGSAWKSEGLKAGNRNRNRLESPMVAGVLRRAVHQASDARSGEPHHPTPSCTISISTNAPHLRRHSAGTTIDM